MKKVVLVALAFLVAVAGVFAGGQSSSRTGGDVATSNFNFTGYPMNRMSERISWADLDGINLATRIGSADQSPFHTNYSRMVGTNIDWIFPTVGTSYEQMFTQLMAGAVRDLPNIMQGGGTLDTELLIAEGVMWDLTPYMERWSPNYTKFLQSRPEAAKAMRTDSGKYWTYGFFREDGPFLDTWMGPIVRRDWLTAQNLPMPRTIADWDRTLQVFKERYGSMIGFQWRWYADFEFLAGAFGAYATHNFQVFVRDGRVQAANTTREYREYLTKLNEWYTKGYIDPDYLIMDGPMFNSKALDGKIGLTLGALSVVTELVNNAAAARVNQDWVGLEYPRSANNTLSAIQGGWGINNNAAAWIPKSTPPEKLELAMRVLDYAYSPEGFLFTNYGLKGDTWDYDSSGKVIWLPKFLNDVDAPDFQQVVTKYGGMRGSGPGIQATRMVELINAPASFAAASTWYTPGPQAAASWRMPPLVTYTIDESLRMSELWNPMATYIAETTIGFVTGQTPLSQFDAFVNRLNQMGLPEYLRIQQAAYDRWQKR